MTETDKLKYVSRLNYQFLSEPYFVQSCPWRECLGTNTPSPHTSRKWEPKYQNGVFPDVLDMIGNTPMVKLNHIPKKEGLKCNIYAKCEFLNPSGSIKDRMVKRMFEDAEEQGLIKPGMTIIEASSGNTGIAMATVTSLKGYKCIIVLPEKMSAEKEMLMTSLGAQVVRVPSNTSSVARDGILGVVHRLRQEIPNSFIFDQFYSPSNPLAHYDTTAEEILAQLDNKVDMIVLGGGTGGTITGIGRKLKEISPQTKLVGVDPYGSQVAYPPSINVTNTTFWEIEGIGYEFVAATLDQSVCDHWIKINDTQSLNMSRRLMKEEGLLVGMSSGSFVYGAIQAAKDLKEGQNVVVLLPDSIRNYMTKFVSDRWMEAKGYQPCINNHNLWWWDQKVTNVKYKTPVFVDSKDTLEDVIAVLDSHKVGEAVVMLPNGSMLGTITTKILKNKLIAGLLQPTDLVERCTTRILPKLDNDSTLGRAFRIIEEDGFAVVVNTIGVGPAKIEQPLGLISAEDLYAYTRQQNK